MTEIIQKDTNDARRLLNAEALTSLARQIHQHHSECQERVEALRTEAEQVCTFAISIAREVETAHASLGGRRFREWWDEQKLPIGWAEKYLTLAKTSDRNTIGDKDQLRLIGILPESEGHNEGQQRVKTGFEWLKHAGKVASSFKADDVARMPETEAVMALRKLEPLKALIAALERRTGRQAAGGKMQLSPGQGTPRSVN